LNRTDKTLEAELQQAFVSGKIARLARFTHWCASQTAVEGMPESYVAALELMRKRAEGECDALYFSGHADRLLRSMPIAATVIGLKHGAPNAMRLLAIAAGLDTGPLTAAIQSSRNQRGYERLLAQRAQGQEDGGGPVVVAIRGARQLTDEGAPPSVAEARCAERQLQAWRSM
jgi:hypothetical protein